MGNVTLEDDGGGIPEGLDVVVRAALVVAGNIVPFADVGGNAGGEAASSSLWAACSIVLSSPLLLGKFEEVISCFSFSRGGGGP